MVIKIYNQGFEYISYISKFIINHLNLNIRLFLIIDNFFKIFLITI